MARMIGGVRYAATEWAFTAETSTDKPFEDVELDVLVTHESGASWRVPAFWSGGREWRVRFGPPLEGSYRWRSECAPDAVAGLHGVEGELVVAAAPETEANPLLQHGPVRVASSHTHFEHDDGTPFFWLGDTWWMGLAKRMGWPDDFQRLAADRTEKGFSVIQIVAGLYPDMDWRDSRSANAAGFPYSEDFRELNPAYFDDADLRIRYLVSVGMVPCIVGCWGYFLKWTGIEMMKRHWRYLVARWGAYPVLWCLAGEGTMPWYLSETKEQDAREQKEGWTEIGRYVRSIDPYHRPLTIHPTDKGRDQVTDDSILDFDMLQTGHGGPASVPNNMRLIREACARTPTMPALVAEVDYEGFMIGNYDQVQRLLFWGSMLSGAAGHTYGANGIWQVNTHDEPYGPSPHGNTWGNRPWDEAMRLSGSANLGVGKRLLERFPWWEFQPHQEWVEPAASDADFNMPYAAGIPGRVRVIYTYHTVWGPSVRVKAIEPDITYRAFYSDPETGVEHDLGTVAPDEDGSWLMPQQPELRDWVLVMERM